MPEWTPAGEIDASLFRSKKKLSIKDLRLPWKPIYELLKGDLFMPRRQFDMGYESVHGSNRGATDAKEGGTDIWRSAWDSWARLQGMYGLRLNSGGTN